MRPTSGSLRFLKVEPSEITSPQYADSSIAQYCHVAKDLIARSCKVADTYEEGSLKDVTIEGVDAFIQLSLRNYCAKTHKPT